MTLDQIKAALAAAIAFLFAACAALAVILFQYQTTTEMLAAERLSLAYNVVGEYARNNGWNSTKQILHQERAWGDTDRPNVWLLEADLNRVIDAEADFSLQDALRALTKPGHGVAVVGPRGDSRRLHVAETVLGSNRLFVGITTASSDHASALVIRAVFWSSLAGIAGALAAVYWASRRSNSRISEMKRILASFLAGKTAERVNFSGPVDSLYELAHSVNRTLDRSEALTDDLSYLSSDIAHNLKKPLTRLRGQLDRLSDAGDTSQLQRDLAEKSVHELDGMITIFEALLNISQFQSGIGRSHFRDVDLLELTTHLVDTYRAIIEDSGKLLETQLPDSVPYVRGDPELIMELVVNIIENAIQHCPNGTTISLSVLSSSDEVSIVVADDGPGVPTEAVEAVLERFHRLDASRPGHGIGLPFAVAVAELHIATLELADNDPGLKVSVGFPIDFSKLTPQLGLRMRSGLRLKLHSKSPPPQQA